VLRRPLRSALTFVCVSVLAAFGVVRTQGAGTATVSNPSAVDSVPIASYTFDDGVGGPDPMGWTTVDLTAQVGTFFHVDDFAGLGGGDKGGLLPLAGARSMWCGA